MDQSLVSTNVGFLQCLVGKDMCKLKQTLSKGRHAGYDFKTQTGTTKPIYE